MAEMYYFIESNGKKEGPLKLSDITGKQIKPNDLVWRSDGSEWKEAFEFDELKSCLIVSPPPLPIDELRTKARQKFVGLLPIIAVGYFLSSLILGIAASKIAFSSWQKYLTETGGVYQHESSISYESRSFGSSPSSIPLKELLDNKRYPFYERGVNLEHINAIQQPFLFKPFKAFYSTIYLTRNEQQNRDTFGMNILISAFVTMALIFSVATSTYYLILMSSIKPSPNETRSNS